MVRDKISCISILAVLALLTQITWVASPHSRSLNARVQFLATSTSVRSSLATSQDVYLVELIPNKGDTALLAKLIDEYPPYRAPLPLELLTSPVEVALRVYRDSACDIAYSRMPLRTPPGDPMTILPEPLGFQPKPAQQPGPHDILPCYRVLRQ